MCVIVCVCASDVYTKASPMVSQEGTDEKVCGLFHR